MRFIPIAASLAVCLTSLAGSASAQPAQSAAVTVTEAWSRATTGAAQTAAIYVTVTAGQPDRLTGASTPAAATTELHQSRMEGGVMQMRAVPDGLPVSPGSPIHMAPGGYHLMLMGLKRPLRQGDHVPVTLTFDHAGTITADAIVAGPGASAPPRLP